MAADRNDGFLSTTAKRAFDLAVAVPLALVTAPGLLLAALLIRVQMGSPVVFRQVRAGKDGAPIRLAKLRTMTNDRDESGELLPDHLRITRLGSMLRGTAVDELPQLWAIIRGDMSVVGPRPLPEAYVSRYSELQRRRLEVKPGLTGWAQVNGRNRLTWDERFDLDVYYVHHRSFRLDVKILSKTIQTLLDRGSVGAIGHATMPEFTNDREPDAEPAPVPALR